MPALTIVGAGRHRGRCSGASSPTRGRYPFSWQDLLAACVFCLLGLALTWRVERRATAALAVRRLSRRLPGRVRDPSRVGENVARLRYVAIPVAVLALSLRRWRPLPVAVGALALAVFLEPDAAAVRLLARARDPPRARPTGSRRSVPARHLSPSYRVEAVDTAGHWDAVYLPGAGIPLARGWFRQDDFPQNAPALRRPLGPKRVPALAARLGVRYVVLTDAPPDYSARDEATLLRSGNSGLSGVLETPQLTIFAVPRPRR